MSVNMAIAWRSVGYAAWATPCVAHKHNRWTIKRVFAPYLYNQADPESPVPGDRTRSF